ncbi:EAL domain-containing protein [[Enterobacter] lignolyticus]|uniref:cyclic-guanylate-specific phosphodiesterase n=1 Tax=Enterobacter lignolyticus (strain SCF1) TaxID=701347 RepID=E3GD51_ENTLS|nr:cyclic diguanylate phosphodiesterase [[Enterobacter] lignolyticus]ADO49070.1 diguanylate phosphodiesterase [[Enterobacter] lignolyticus SCF1]
MDIKSLNKRILISFITTLSLFLLSSSVLYIQSVYSLKSITKNNLNQITQQLDRMIGYAENALNRADKYAGSDCSKETLEALRVLEANTPNIRSINLISNGHTYCSSIYGETSELKQEYSETRLSVYISKVINPGVPFVVLNHYSQESKKGVVATIDGFYIYNVLSMARVNFPVYLRIGDDVISSLSNNIVNKQNIAINGYLHVQKPSQENYLVYSDYSFRDTWLYFISNEKTSLILIAMFSVLAGSSLFYFSGKEPHPKEALKRAIKKNEIVPWIQPIFNRDAKVCGGEILARWLHPEKGVIAPDNFIPVAEENDLIIPLTRSLLKQVQHQLKDTITALPDGFHVAFNISPDYFNHDFLIDDVDDFLVGFKERKPIVVLEVTERQQLNDDINMNIINHLRDKNIMIALDDFGTGYSSLSYLKNCKFDYIKIDKSFTQDIISKTHIGNIVKNIIELSNSVGAKNIAEGVETTEQFEELKSLNVEFYQGYLFSRPISMDDFKDKYL